MVVGSTRREGGAGDALTSALLLKYTSERHPRGVVHLLRHLSPQRKRRTFIDLVARLRFLFVSTGHVPLARPPK